MDTFNEVIPYNLDMQWVKNDTFTLLGDSIVCYLCQECDEPLLVESYSGILSIKYRPQDPTLQTITTASGDMVFTDNVITFNKPDLNLKVGSYFYQLKLIDNINNNNVGTLLEGEFKVKQ